MTFLAALWAKFEGWLIAFGAVLVAIGAAIFYGWRKGSDNVQAKVDQSQAEQKVNTATAVASRVEAHAEIESEVAQLPVSPVVAPTAGPGSNIAPGATAVVPVPGSAADRLQHDWSRD